MTTQEVQEVSKLLRTIEDFPEKGEIGRASCRERV